jgi:hypothetical protein
MSATDMKCNLTAVTRHSTGSNQSEVFRSGNLEFTTEYGGNGSLPSYQEASGAPVERQSPLGYNIGWFTIIFLNIGQMIGTAIFSTRKCHVFENWDKKTGMVDNKGF